MEMVPLDDLLPEVLAYAPNVADPMAFRFLREAARDLCEAGKLWREWDAFQVSTPAAEGICTIQDAEIVSIEAASLGGYDLTPVTPAWLDKHEPDWDSVTDSANARYVTQLNPTTVTVVPHVTGELKVRLVLRPSRTARSVPAWLAAEYGTELGKGAAGRILIMPDPAISNPQLGPALVAEFRGLLSAVKRKAAKGKQGAPLRTRARFM